MTSTEPVITAFMHRIRAVNQGRRFNVELLYCGLNESGAGTVRVAAMGVIRAVPWEITIPEHMGKDLMNGSENANLDRGLML